MSPGQHFIISWVTANTIPLDRKSRVCITISGLIPDIDGFGYILDRISPFFGSYTNYYAQYHHVYGHNIFAALMVAVAFALLCNKKITVFVLSLLAFNLHILCDIAGARGLDGHQWPIAYLYPLFPNVQITWSGQWALSSWINSFIGVSFFLIALIIARYRHITFFELLSLRFEREVCKVAKQRGFFKLLNNTG